MSSSPGRATIRRATCTSTRNGKLVVKWDLENWQPMKGEASARVLQLIRELEDEGVL